MRERDSMAARDAAYNPEHHDKLKHVERCSFAIWSVEKFDIVVPHVPTTYTGQRGRQADSLCSSPSLSSHVADSAKLAPAVLHLQQALQCPESCQSWHWRPSAFQCPALGWHWSGQCLPVSHSWLALQWPSAPVPHRNDHPKSYRSPNLGWEIGRHCQELCLLR